MGRPKITLGAHANHLAIRALYGRSRGDKSAQSGETSIYMEMMVSGLSAQI